MYYLLFKLIVIKNDIYGKQQFQCYRIESVGPMHNELKLIIKILKLNYKKLLLYYNISYINNKMFQRQTKMF